VFSDLLMFQWTLIACTGVFARWPPTLRLFLITRTLDTKEFIRKTESNSLLLSTRDFCLNSASPCPLPNSPHGKLQHQCCPLHTRQRLPRYIHVTKTARERLQKVCHRCRYNNIQKLNKRAVNWPASTSA
jgi:hypothetical protein